MKKLLSIVLVIGILMSVMSLSVSAVDTALTDEETTAVLTKMIRADIDGDGELTMVDSFELKYRISKGFWRV